MVGEPLRGTSRLQVEMSLQGKLLPSLGSPAPVSLPGRPARAEAESCSPRGRRGDQTPPTSLAPATRALEHTEPAVLGVLPLSPRSTCGAQPHTPGSHVSSLTPVPASCHLLRAHPDHPRMVPNIPDLLGFSPLCSLPPELDLFASLLRLPR